MTLERPAATETTAGAVRGRIVDGVATYLGIPFAAAPVGALRFQAPRPAAKWAGVRDCFDYGATAPQPDRGLTLIPEPIGNGDDYLNLNVFTPGKSGDRLPVLVWIHGGGFFGGCNQSPWYRGHRFARDGVVFVSVNYRLGAEGFMPMRGAPANRGVLDWLAALRWIKENIAAFGGDPDSITISGQSAGAMACVYLLTLRQARGLFHRVIAMSGSVGVGAASDDAERTAAALRASLGAADEAGVLARVPIADFVAAQTRLGDENLSDRSARAIAERAARGLRFAPAIDGESIERSPLSAIADGAGAAIPVLLSFTAEEFDFLTLGATGLDSDRDLIPALARLGLSEQDAEGYRRLHAELPRHAVLGRAMSDRLFRWRALQMAAARNGSVAPTYVAEFRWRPAPAVAERLGACHCIDIPFAFDLLDAPGVARLAGPTPPRSLASGWHGAMVAFVKSGDPGWPAYDTAQRRIMLVDDEPHSKSDPLRREVAFWTASGWA